MSHPIAGGSGLRPRAAVAPRRVTATLTLSALALTAVAAVAQQPLVAPRSPESPTRAVTAAPQPAPVRCDPARSLGVARILEIDTETGPRFGHVQYKDHQLLQDGEVILTFDDGPLRANTQRVVDALEAQCTKATFFMVGSQALADPQMVQQIQRKGHTIANHTWSHADLRKMAPMNARREIELGFSAVALAAGQPIAPFFRFPFLSDTTAMKDMAGTRGYGIFSIDIDALDYRNKDNPEAVHAEVMKHLAYQRKGILLFHDIHASTALAMPGILAELKRKNFKVVHIRPVRSIVTLPEFDVVARKDFGAKRTASAANPLAPRGVTYPMPSRDSLSGPGNVFGPPPLQQVQPAPQPLPRVTRPLPPAEDWRRSVLGN